MRHNALAAGLVLGAVACTSLPPPPMEGDGGTMGAAGESGMGGDGGTGGDGDLCPSVTWRRDEALLESSDTVSGPIDTAEFDVATGTVSLGTDDVDGWRIETCAGAHDIVLSWDRVEPESWLLLRAGGVEGIAAEFTSDGGNVRRESRLAGVVMSAGEPSMVTVETVDANEILSLAYEVRVIPLE